MLEGILIATRGREQGRDGDAEQGEVQGEEASNVS